ncbi:hypothetical protein [Thorsellia anophelis]|uniref:Uncharacterized protein n=1 Tax=Thorsellia anophelis DSM 18579 TaxID=1123402 RepID=A0A1H9Y4R7_9GAMM|nr:hypothetical protein [Thorsellia anophelis]SES63779.1 hypothetical protein SAMN02583745_00051 [Thorsellia anophelis DSM 18579]
MQNQLKSSLFSIGIVCLSSFISLPAIADDCQYIKEQLTVISKKAQNLTQSAERNQNVDLLLTSLLSNIDTLEEPSKTEVCSNAKLKIEPLLDGIAALELESK